MKRFSLAVFLATLMVLGGLIGRAAKLEQLRLVRLSARVDSLVVTVRLLAQSKNASAQAIAANVPATGVLFAGDTAAPVTIIEFMDYECPFCKRHSRATLPVLRTRLIQPGKARYIVKDLPLPIHSHAVDAAIAVRCAASQSQSAAWNLHDALLATDSALSRVVITNLAAKAGVDLTSFSVCMKDPAIRTFVDSEVKEAQKFSLTGTPSFVIGPSDSKGLVRGVIVRGAASIERLDSLVMNANATKSKFGRQEKAAP